MEEALFQRLYEKALVLVYTRGLVEMVLSCELLEHGGLLQQILIEVVHFLWTEVDWADRIIGVVIVKL
jgi:hypothetical protein